MVFFKVKTVLFGQFKWPVPRSTFASSRIKTEETGLKCFPPKKHPKVIFYSYWKSKLVMFIDPSNYSFHCIGKMLTDGVPIRFTKCVFASFKLQYPATLLKVKRRSKSLHLELKTESFLLYMNNSGPVPFGSVGESQQMESNHVLF